MTTFNNVSTLFIQQQTTNLMRAGRQQLFDLQAQIASGKRTNDLSTLSATNTRLLLDARSGITRYENYTLSIKTVDTRLNVQDTILNNLQDIVAQSSSLVANAQTFQAAVDLGADSQLTSFLTQVGVYLNERVGDRQLFSGNRFSVEPVKNLNTLPVPPTEPFPFTPLASPTVPQYDTSYMSQIEVASVAANNGASTLTLGSSSWSAQGYQVGDTVTLSGTGTDGTFTITNLAGGVATVTPAPTTIAADNTFTAVRNTATEGPGSYVRDGLYIDDNFFVTYGISSNADAMQNMILGLRWAYAATQDSTNYTTYMTRADQLLGTARDQLRVLQADTAANQGLMDQTLEAHKRTTVLFQNQQGNVIDADVNEAATQLSILSAQIEASYAATGRIVNLSITQFL